VVHPRMHSRRRSPVTIGIVMLYPIPATAALLPHKSTTQPATR
jgi:hypothetical protein